jgi:hypothetical protein
VSARLARVLVSTGAAALALGLVAPSAALADDGDKGDKGAKGGQSSDHRSGAKGDKSSQDKGDPAGNNGTIKIQPYGGISGHSNSPHPGCDFRLQLFNFDDDQTGTITFAGQAPTKGAVTKQPLAGTQNLSTDAAGGGQDVDAFFDVRGASLGLTGTPAKQGFHIKVYVDADNAPGGAKQKVFWLDCPAPAAATTTGTAGGGSSKTSSSSTSQSVVSSSTSTGVASGAATGSTVPGSATTATTATGATGGVTSQSATSNETAFTGGSAAAATRAPARATQERGSALPFTGVPLLALVGIALATLAAGALAIRAGRRRTATQL